MVYAIYVMLAGQVRGRIITNGFKMKWRNLGPGRVQLRLPVAIVRGRAYLCEAYIKTDAQVEQRKLAKFKAHVQMIREGRYSFRGLL